MIDQTTHERRVSASVSTLAVASVAHPKETSLSSPNVITQADLMYTKSEQISSVSYLFKYVFAVTDDWQTQQTTSGIFTNAQNTRVTGGTFTVVSLCYCVYDFSTNSTDRIISMSSPLMLVESRRTSL